MLRGTSPNSRVAVSALADHWARWPLAVAGLGVLGVIAIWMILGVSGSLARSVPPDAARALGKVIPDRLRARGPRAGIWVGVAALLVGITLLDLALGTSVVSLDVPSNWAVEVRADALRDALEPIRLLVVMLPLIGLGVAAGLLHRPSSSPGTMEVWKAALGANVVRATVYPGEGHTVQYRHRDQTLADIAGFGDHTVICHRDRTRPVPERRAQKLLSRGATLALCAWTAAR